MIKKILKTIFLCVGFFAHSQTNFTLIPDDNFENELIALGYDDIDDGKVETARINVISTLNLTSRNIYDLTGIEDFTGLTVFTLERNPLTSLDLSKNTKIEELYCSYNDFLKSIVVGSNVIKKSQIIYNFSLVNLDFSNKSLLTSLECNNNQLSVLNVNGCTSLKILNCRDNLLTSLDLSTNTLITNLFCSINKIDNLVITNCPALIELNCQQNSLASLNLLSNINLTNLNCSVNKLTDLNLSNNGKLVTVNASINELTAITLPTIATVLATLNCSTNKLKNLNVIPYTRLRNLNFSSNLLSDINLAENIRISLLDCSKNNLNAIDVSKNVLLSTLYCNSNNISSLDLVKNTALKFFNCSSNALTYLNIRNLNNSKIDYVSMLTSFSNNPNLYCIQVDDVGFSQANWSNLKDPTANFSTDCNSLSIEDSGQIEDKVSVFPNPAKNIVNIQNIELEKVFVLDLLGNNVSTILFDSSRRNNTIDLSNLPRGIYLVKMLSGKTAITRKIILE
jgi:trimeric autotransporter adhesin